jgi:phasin family protein
MAAKAGVKHASVSGLGLTGFGGAAVPNMEPLVEASSKMLDSWVALSSEILEFNKARLDQSFEAGRAIAASSTLNEAMDLQAKFTRAMVQEYLTEATKIADISTRTIMDGVNALQKTAKAEPSVADAAE